VFLADIDAMPRTLQSKLAHALRAHTAARAGSERPEAIETRVIASTKVDLAAAVAAGTFDHDLFELLSHAQIPVTPLRERRDDLEALIKHFLRMFGSGRPQLEVSVEAGYRIHTYAWPGNVLELKSCIERACKRTTGDVISVEHLAQPLRDLPGDVPTRDLMPVSKPTKIVTGGTHVVSQNGSTFTQVSAPATATLRPGEIGSDDPISLDHYEKKCLERALDATGGDKLKAAKLLKVGKSTLYRKLKRYGIT
jgi:DNA-binding NtrC family response regulator